MNEVTHQKCGELSNNLSQLSVDDYEEMGIERAYCQRCQEYFEVILVNGYWEQVEDEMMALDTVEDLDLEEEY